MPFDFQKVRLEAKSLFALINTWAEMQLIVQDRSAEIIGFGSTDEIAEAFTILVFDWEATISLSLDGLDIPEGSYDLIREGDIVHACRHQKSYPVTDRPVVVEVISVPES